jgi:hypothetical protein
MRDWGSPIFSVCGSDLSPLLLITKSSFIPHYCGFCEQRIASEVYNVDDRFTAFVKNSPSTINTSEPTGNLYKQRRLRASAKWFYVCFPRGDGGGMSEMKRGPGSYMLIMKHFLSCVSIKNVVNLSSLRCVPGEDLLYSFCDKKTFIDAGCTRRDDQ